jgi:hypothetical protein
LVGEDLPGNAERFQCASGGRFAHGVKAEYQMFGTDVVIVARSRFGLGPRQQGSGQRRELWWAFSKEGFGLSSVLTLRRVPSQVSHCYLRRCHELIMVCAEPYGPAMGVP